VSALMATSAMAFSVLKWVGAAYLLYVGVLLLLYKSPDAIKIEAGGADSVKAGGLKSLFFRGFWTNALNPKVALFFLAFVPQFIAPGAAHPTVAFLVLGVLFNLNAIPINIGYAVLAAWAARRTAAIQRGMHWLDRLAGALFVGFGIKLALSAAPKV
jgi:threonine/homoserine/homoserine lactone efflux protein